MKQTCCLPENNDTQGIVKFSFSLKVNKRKRWITRTRNPPFFIVSVWKQCKLFYLISDRYSSYPSSFIFSLGMKRSEALLMQYRSPPFSFGPSVNTCPKWASPVLLRTSVRTIPWWYLLSPESACGQSAWRNWAIRNRNRTYR